MLAAILGHVYLSKAQLSHPEELLKKLDSIEQLSNRAADMVRQLLAFARKDSPTMTVISLNECIEEGYTLVKASVPANIELHVSLCDEQLAVSGDVTQLQQVLMNLINNARDAVASVAQPCIRCSLERYVANKDFIRHFPAMEERNFARLQIQDNGPGIPREHLNKIFEPFFTTKGIGEGTGLGLAMVYGTVQSHSGQVEVSSDEYGGGTCVNVYLPLVTLAQTSTPEEKAIVNGHGETILLADDEQSMRDTTAEVLISLGYTVFSARNGEDALRVFHAHSQYIALILTDVVMPKMGGVALAQRIRQSGSEVPVIFATGYDRYSTMMDSNEVRNSRVIAKPFSFQQLSHSIREMIEA